MLIFPRPVSLSYNMFIKLRALQIGLSIMSHPLVHITL